MKILAIETATDTCSVAFGDGRNTFSRLSRDRNAHSSNLSLFIKEVLDKSGQNIDNLDAVVVSKGPGSFTGLRIGVSLAKGIAWGLDIPLISVSTLTAMAYSLITEINEKTLLCPVIDARNNEFYFAVYDHLLQEILPVSAGQIETKAFKKIINGREIIFFGDGIDKTRDVLNSLPYARIRENVFPDAANLIPLALQKYATGDFENLSTFEPFYLRDFKARNLGKKIARILYPENE
jgi:tRNA threonylcarbamoyladenosine biosynthesis protein TsaB